MTEKISFFIFSFLFTALGVGVFRQWSRHRGLLDIPNERSSHKTPTPRGGGLIIVLTCLVGTITYSFISRDFSLWSYLAGGILISVISWYDDLRSVSTVLRLLIHSIAALGVIYFLGYFRIIGLPIIGSIDFGVFGAILTFLWIVWITNAFNFMDGIDGIAASQAVIGGIGWAIIGWLLQVDEVFLIGGIVTSAAMGFLIHNWQPARVFMGDVGSAFLGFTFGVIPVIAVNEVSSDFIGWIPMIGVAFVSTFFIDSILTITRRGFRGEKVWRAHREHIYQQLVQRGYSHAFVTTLYSLISSAIVLLVVVTLMWFIKTKI